MRMPVPREKRSEWVAFVRADKGAMQQHDYTRAHHRLGRELDKTFGPPLVRLSGGLVRLAARLREMGR